VYYLATAFSVAQPFLHGANTPQYFMSRRQNVGKNLDIKVANRSFESVAQFRYMGTAATNQKLIRK
jgi:hypothetical protein